MLTNVEMVKAMPGMSNLASVPTAFLNDLIGAADRAIKTYLKREIELRAYVEYYNGTGQPDIICRQYPVWSGNTTVAAGSNGATLPTSTINVESTHGFDPGTASNPDAVPPSIAVQTGTTTWTRVTYTGTTATSFTGCSGGTGTLATGYRVASPVIYFDMGGYGGQAPNGFGTNSMMVPGTQFMVALDSGGLKSNRGLIRKIGGSGAGFYGLLSPETFMSGKLAGYRLPYWPLGQLNLKVCYSAGFAPYEVPFDLKQATTMLVAYMVRNMPSGGPLSSESLGAYSYSILQASVEIPELGSIPRTLAPYREVSFPGGS